MSDEQVSGFHLSAKTMLTACVFAGLVAGCSERQAPTEAAVPRPVKTITLQGASDVEERQFPGKVRASKRVDLSFQVAGKLIELPVLEGQLVKAGELIAKLDDRDFTSSLRSAQAESDHAVANFRRATILIKDGNISKTDYDKLRSAEEVAAANLAKARKALDDTVLNAPFRGRIASRFVENFTDVQAKQPVVSLQDVTELEILVDVPEREAMRVKPGQKPASLKALFSSLPEREFPLQVKEFSTQADPNTQTFRAVLSMQQPEGVLILPGMTATVVVQRTGAAATDSQAGFKLPVAALVADAAGASHVWVVDAKDNSVQRRAVQTGALTGNAEVVILSGLEAGEMIAVSGVSRLQEGMVIRPVDKVEF